MMPYPAAATRNRRLGRVRAGSRSGRRARGALAAALGPPARRSRRGGPTAGRRGRRARARTPAWCRPGASSSPAGPAANESSDGRRGVAEHAGQQPGDRLGDDQHGHLAPGQHVVAERDLLDRHPRGRVLGHPRVDALVAPAGEHQPGLGGEPRGGGLGERGARPASARPGGAAGRRAGRARPARGPTARAASPCPGRRRRACRRRCGGRRRSSAAGRARRPATCPRSIALPSSDCRSGAR